MTAGSSAGQGTLNAAFDAVSLRLSTSVVTGTPALNTSHFEEQAIWDLVFDPVTNTIRTIEVA